MKLDLVIPTVGRREKLLNCINSILRSAKDNKNIKLVICFSEKGELDYFDKFFKDIKEIELRQVYNYRVPDFWNSYLQECKADAMCYLNDDVILFEDTIETIINYYTQYFPDFDGVMGLNQVNIKDSNKVEAAFGVIGIKYADRFPNKQVFCPDYSRFFADFELWQYAKYINKFKFCIPAQINHLHPSTDPALLDDTHYKVRKWLFLDKQIFINRKHKKWLWGKDHNLLKKGTK